MISAKKLVSSATAVFLATSFAVGAAVSASAAPWDGNDIVMSNSKWRIGYAPFVLDRVSILVGGVYDDTNIVDGALVPQLSFDDWSSSEEIGVASSTDVDVVTEQNGDVVLKGTASGFSVSDVSATVEFRIFAEGDLVRQMVTLTNSGTSTVSVDLQFNSELGSKGVPGSGGGILAVGPGAMPSITVPAAEDTTTMESLNTAGAGWVARGSDGCSSPMSFAWGHPDSTQPATVQNLNGVRWIIDSGDITLAPGESTSVAVFIAYAPGELISRNYNRDICAPADQTAYNAAVITGAAEFNSFAGRLTAGLDDTTVLNWTSVAPAPGPDSLPDTGVDVAALGAIGALAILIGAGAFVGLCRRAS